MSDTSTTPAADEVRPFTQFLYEQQNGNLHSELSEELQALVAACMEHQKQGTLVLKITVKPMSNGVNVTVSDEVKVNAPQPDRADSLFYATRAGNLSRRNPAQPELPNINDQRDARKAG